VRITTPRDVVWVEVTSKAVGTVPEPNLQAVPRGTLRIASPPTLTQIRLAPIFARFLARYPEVRLRVEVTNREIDPQAEGFDALLRVRIPPLADSALLMRSLGPTPRPLVASPAFLERFGSPVQPSDFTAQPAVMMASPSQPMQWRLWNPHLGQDAPPVTVPLDRVRLFTDDAWTCRHASLGRDPWPRPRHLSCTSSNLPGPSLLLGLRVRGPGCGPALRLTWKLILKPGRW
jgi:DNA-binding transcriptional LysR family regulator